MRWSEYTATLAEVDHRRLLTALGAGLAPARQASEVATQNGAVEDARRHHSAAVLHCLDALAVLGPSETT